ncbi:MAG TPA: helix-turn-helix transcriptional regulator [Candidatus Avilachnospira avicola]|nr:helix-turn-helix transcriptional regulator [Candidatus Avilachnospira avicola]
MTDKEYFDYTAKLIKDLRKKSGLTAKEAAEKLGLKYSTYSNYENGNRIPSYKTLKLIATYYNLSAEDLLPPEDNIHIKTFDINFSNLFKGQSPIKEIKNDIPTKINKLLLHLNEKGQLEALKRIEELTRLPEYKCYPLDNHIQIKSIKDKKDIS